MAPLPEIDLAGADVLRDPVAAYGEAREQAPLARLHAPGIPPMWAVTRYREAKAVLADPRFEVTAASFALRPRDLPADCLPYLRTMQEMNGPEHARLRRLVSPAFGARRAAGFRPRIEKVVAGFLDALSIDAENGHADLVSGFARPLPMEVIGELIGVPPTDRPRWHRYGAAVAAGAGQDFAEAVPRIIADARAAIAQRRDEPGDDLVSELLRGPSGGGEKPSEAELITLVWHLVLAGQVPAHLIANAVDALLAHPAQLAALREDPGLMPGAVEELLRWCGPQLLTIPRYPREDTEIGGTPIPAGEPVVTVIAAANRDPRAFPDAGRLDVTRPVTGPGHLAFAHGPHFCLGAAPARVQTEAALTALLQRFPRLAPLPDGARRVPDPATLRLAGLHVALQEPHC
ncbi:cytochrome P450 [Amycolatopsis pigmentata]|uniref:Cytochrome P450 n=1 Tax=Amycolatopsis pigmentata TaxID=450801 RepID=A0ABW5FNA5_9PSEU